MHIQNSKPAKEPEQLGQVDTSTAQVDVTQYFGSEMMSSAQSCPKVEGGKARAATHTHILK